MKSFFEDCIAIIKDNNPELYIKIAGLKAGGNISTISLKAGGEVPVIEIENRKIYIHSKFDPFKEAKRFISDIDPSLFDLFIVFGFGFGYHIEELIKRVKSDSTLLVFEKDPWILKEAITYRDLTSLLKDNRLKILVDPDEEIIADILRGRSSKRVSFLTHRGSFQIFPDYYNNLRRITKSYLSVKEVNIATLSRFEKTWSSNIARNIREFIRLPGANVFYDKLVGIPAIIAGAGPSLNRSINFIKNHQDQAVIICVDTSYSVLMKNNIIPHFCITVDPQVINARYFEGFINGETIFIADPSVHPSIFRLIKGNISILGMAFEMMKWIEEITSEKGELLYGGSVTTNAYDFAKRIGASPIIMVGQDFAFTDGLAHARGTYLDEEVYLKANRFYNAHMQNRYQLYALPRIKVRGIRSEEIYTNQKLMIFLAWFEKRNDPDLINSSFDGAFIKDINHIPTNEIIFPEIKKNIYEIILNIYKKSKAEITKLESIKKILLNKCMEMEKELISLLSVLQRAVSLSKELIDMLKENDRDSKFNYILNRLTETDKIIESKNTLKDMIGFTIQRVIHTITEGYNIDVDDDDMGKEELIAKKSHYLYKGILEGSEFNIKILKKMITLLEDN